MFAIYSIDPDEDNNEVYRLLEIFDTKQDAEIVLEALEKVNIGFNLYRIEDIGV